MEENKNEDKLCVLVPNFGCKLSLEDLVKVTCDLDPEHPLSRQELLESYALISLTEKNEEELNIVKMSEVMKNAAFSSEDSLLILSLPLLEKTDSERAFK